jgi:hypothetical protein
MFLYWLLLALVFGYAQQESPTPEERAAARQEASLRYDRFRQESIRINELAGNIKSEADARAFVDSVADMFADSLHPSWVTTGIRERIADVEEAIVTVAEIHSMRDTMFATGQVAWSRGRGQSAWTMPNIYAVGDDGKVAEDCRAVEALRVLYDLDQMFDNLRST